MPCNLNVKMNRSCMDICVIILHVDIIHLGSGQKYATIEDNDWEEE